LQDAAQSRLLADRLAGAIVKPEISPEHAAFIARCDFFFLATVDDGGFPTVSYKGGAPGFVRMIDQSTLVFPDYDGNGMFLSMGNVAATGKIGMLFIDFERPHRLRVQATAAVHDDHPELANYPGAKLLVRAAVDEDCVNCGRYIHRHRRQAPSKYVPDGAGRQPYPAWKRIDGLQDALPPADQGRAEAEGGTITDEAYEQRVRAGDP
jgi:uncharacterized protein